MSTKLSPAIVAAGGEKLTVILENGTEQEVLVRLLKLGEYAQYMARVDHELNLAAYLTGNSVEWASKLAAQSVMEIVSLGHDLNFTGACLWATRRAKLTEAALPVQAALKKAGIVDSRILEKEIQKMTSEPASPPPSPV
ncbi:hypothetical protein [Oleiharenicola lentus]|uniref:hypothetical protein n=1 Tax=Oleiharenicola lentus TaxID=2508720 RepID=UPI003F66A4B3